MTLLVPVQLERNYCGLKNRVHTMSVAVRISRITFSSACLNSVLWYALLMQLLISTTAMQHRKNITPAVDVSVYSDVSEINSTTHAQFLPMFGAPGDIDSSQDGGSTIRLRLDSRSGMPLMPKTLLRICSMFSIVTSVKTPSSYAKNEWKFSCG